MAEGLGQRSINVLGRASHSPAFLTNRVVTAHYTKFNFVPKNLKEQFAKPANCYFLFLCVLQCLPEVTTTGQMPTIVLPLAFILCVNAVKDAVEDYRRHKSDRVENESMTLDVSAKGQAASKSRWCDVQVGDYIIVKNNEFVPADIVLLTSCHTAGQAFVETANLDGETNLKTKQAPDALFQKFGYIESMDEAVKTVSKMDGSIVCEGPNASLYTFVGTLTQSGGEQVPLDEEHVVLRGCKVKNVPWCLGVVVYTGRETKIMMNSQRKSGRKLSHLEKDVGKFTLVQFLMQAVLCFIAAIVSAVFESSQENKDKTYLNLTDESGELHNPFVLTVVIKFFTFFILFMNFIPISLLVCIAMVKLFQVGFIYADKDMIYEGMHCMPRTSDLNEELGQVEYVFSDKTGTLTRNVMDFRKFCVNGITYGEGVTEIRRNVLAKMGQPVPEDPKPTSGFKTTPHVDLIDAKLDAECAAKSGKQYRAIRECMLHLAINHEVIPNDEGGQLTYSASSPDESALAYGARHLGFVLKTRDSSGVVVQFDDGKEVKVAILNVLKFNSTRKRSSVIAQFDDVDESGKPKKRFVLYTKGADSVIMERLRPDLQQSPETKKTWEVLFEMAEDGLRTLCLGGRDLTQEEYTTWSKMYQAASVATEERQEKLDAAAEAIEKDLEMHGITGIEDRLQENVGPTIVAMAQADIKVWMLTGDKTETAINIGIATGLLEPKEEEGMRPLFASANFEDKDGKFLEEDFIKSFKGWAAKAEEKKKSNLMFEGMVMDGKCLESALCYPDEFCAIAKVCKTVVCCRVSPKQKGAVVRLIKDREKAVTLAIGDGANDCNMIQSADVGVGIRGLEGLQAFNVCDYGISQFRFLAFLLLVHGRWCYRRVACLVNYMFYKNVVIVLPQYYLGMVSGFSGQKLFNDIMYQMYNVVHTSIPIMVYGIIDQDVSKEQSMANPKLYKLGPGRAYLNFKLSAGWLLSGWWHSVVCFIIPFLVMSNGNITNSDGKSNDLWLVGSVVYLCVVIVVNIVVLMETFLLNWVVWIGVGLMAMGWLCEHGWLSGFILGNIMAPELHGTTQRIIGSPMILLVILVTCLSALLADFHIKGFRRLLFPDELWKVQQSIVYGTASK